jgi:demethylmenaquinone methyltransferase/2-methoxy-6-polyprenyl-1,4-benzoquinol methylase
MGPLQRSEEVRQWFSLIAPAYDTVVSPVFWPEWLQQEELDRLDVELDDRVLDIGCGTGKTVEHVGRKVAVHGLDQSRSQLETALAKGDLSGVQFVQGDAHQLPYVDGTFDGVVSVGSILYWSNPVDVLREAHRVTVAGGQILVMGFNRRPLSVWNPVENLQNTINATLFFRYNRSEATALFRRAGWTDIENNVTGPVWSPNLVISTTAKKPERPERSRGKSETSSQSGVD